MAPLRTKRRKNDTLIAEPANPEEHLVQLEHAEVASSVAQGSNFPSLSVFPLELLLEVFSYADPDDLLSLARVNKWLRAILLDRRIEFLWLNALKRVDSLPLAQATCLCFAMLPSCSIRFAQ
ncbi:hypothetical protein HETIRDRAFT_477461, partial [Heterobasidion irregulare TC 32-1]